MKHAVAVEEVVGTTREVLGIGAVADVGPAGEARGNAAADDGAGGRRELDDGGEVVDEDVARVDGGPEDGGVNEVVDYVVEGVAERRGERGRRSRGGSRCDTS